ncbi:MAG TPA: ClbS/DfsB family four-helix bundle protein [Tepidiformaceae bacterium]|nr:ClbS/DfsB family four-helix bundle protein [Tepidiformaceae bacterium]
MDRRQLLAEMRDGRGRWDAALDRVPRERMLEPAFEGGWSLKDVIAHVGAWERVATLRLERGLGRGATLDSFEGAPLDERNQRYYEAHRGHELEDVINGELEAWAQLVSTVEALQEADLHDPSRLGLQADGIPWEMIAGNAHEHFDEHIAQIDEWLAGSGAAEATG